MSISNILATCLCRPLPLSVYFSRIRTPPFLDAHCACIPILTCERVSACVPVRLSQLAYIKTTLMRILYDLCRTGYMLQDTNMFLYKPHPCLYVTCYPPVCTNHHSCLYLTFYSLDCGQATSLVSILHVNSPRQAITIVCKLHATYVSEQDATLSLVKMIYVTQGSLEFMLYITHQDKSQLCVYVTCCICVYVTHLSGQATTLLCSYEH